MAILALAALEFDYLYALWHVEDQSFNKLYVISTMDAALLKPAVAADVYAQGSEFAYQVVRDISRAARLTLPYRMLRDWGLGRPWRQIHLLLDLKGNDGLAAAVAYAQQCFAVRPPRTAQLFSVHPRDLADIVDKTCMICCEEYKHGEIALT